MFDTVYTFYIEDSKRAVTPIIRRYFDGATVSTATGMWRKHVENTLRIEIIADGTRATREKIAALASDLAEAARQTEIIVTAVGAEVTVYGMGKASTERIPMLPDDSDVGTSVASDYGAREFDEANANAEFPA